jgi:hypothetical protein
MHYLTKIMKISLQMRFLQCFVYYWPYYLLTAYKKLLS